MKNNLVTLVWFGLLSHKVFGGPVSTAVLPTGVSRVTVEANIVNFRNEYNGTGESKSLSEPFEKKLSAFELTTLSPGEEAAFRGLLEEENIDSDLGTFDSSVNFNINAYKFKYHIGVSENITAGFGFAVWDASSDVNVTFRPSPNGENFIKNPNVLPEDKRAQLLRVYNDGATAINDKLASQGMDPVGRWESRGLGDLKVGAKYRYAPGGGYTASATGTVLFPTGAQDDPNSLQDIPFSEGAVVPEIEVDHQFDWWRLKPSVGAYARYPLTAKRKYRISETGSYFDSSVKEVSVRNGESFGIHPGLTFRTFDQLSLTAAYRFDWLSAAEYDDNRVINKQEKAESQTLSVGVSFSTIEHYRAKKFFMPLATYLEYKKVLKGLNTYEQQSVVFGTQVFF